MAKVKEKAKDEVVKTASLRPTAGKNKGKGKNKPSGPVKLPDGCLCGCGVKPTGKGRVLPGHDGRIAGWIRAVERGKPDIVPEDRRFWHDLWVKAGKPGGNHPKVIQLVKEV